MCEHPGVVQYIIWHVLHSAGTDGKANRLWCRGLTRMGQVFTSALRGVVEYSAGQNVTTEYHLSEWCSLVPQ